MHRRSPMLFTLLVLLFCFPLAAEAQVGQIANRDAAYQALRRVAVGASSLGVTNFTLKRDAGMFKFRSGNFYLFNPVNDKITGAVFVGDGIFTFDPPLPSEGRNLRLLTSEPQFFRAL